MAKWSDPDADYEQVGTEQAALEDKINAAARGTSSATSRSRWTRCAVRPTTPTSTTLSGGERRRVALVSAAAATPRPAAPRRADQPPRRRVGRVAGAISSRNTAVPSSPSPTTATSWTTSRKWILELDRGRGIPFAGNYSSWLEQKLERMSGEQKQVDARQRTLARELGMGAHGRQGPPGQGQGPTDRLREAAGGGERRAGRPAARVGDRHSARSSAG